MGRRHLRFLSRRKMASRKITKRRVTHRKKAQRRRKTQRGGVSDKIPTRRTVEGYPMGSELGTVVAGPGVTPRSVEEYVEDRKEEYKPFTYPHD